MSRQIGVRYLEAVDVLLEQVFDSSMGFNNPDMPWSELERRLSGRRRPAGKPEDG